MLRFSGIMKWVQILFLLLFLSTRTFAQKVTVVAGKIQDVDGGAFLGQVHIQNLKHPDWVTNSDSSGKYSISVSKNDSVRFTLPGYLTRTLLFTGENEAWFKVVLFTTERIMLDTVVVAQEMTAFEKNSQEHRRLYSKPLRYKPPKATMPHSKDLEGGKPLRIWGPLSGLLGKTSRVYKKNKAFKEMYANTETQLFISQRYDATLVTTLTGLNGDSLYHFMQTYPMTIEYANAATDLEIQMWIKYNYREWIKKKP